MRGKIGHGITLVELLVSTLLLTVLAGMVFQVFRHITQSAQPKMTDRLVVQMRTCSAAETIIQHVRRGTEIVRPHPGETTSYLVVRDVENQMLMYFLATDTAGTKLLNMPVYELRSYTGDFSSMHRPENLKVLMKAVKRLTFTTMGPESVQLNITIAGGKGQEFQFLTHLAVMNLGDIEG